MISPNIMAFDLWNPKKTDVLGLGTSREESQRDSRRAFTRTQKNEILSQQNNKCARCHKRLDMRDVHFHHKKPWADKGRTITQNGRAVDGSCHNIITHQDRLKKIEGKKKTTKRKGKTTTRRRKRSSDSYSLPNYEFPKYKLPDFSLG